MLGKPTSWLASLTLLGGASMVSISAACAGDVVSAAPSSRSPQIMLYVSQPLWSGGGSSALLYGLRIGQLRMPPTSPQLTARPPIQRELIDLQFVAHSEVRIEFASRFTWNITRGAFGQQSNRAVLAIGVLLKGIRRSDAANQQVWDPGSPGMSALTGNPVPRRQADSESLAIVHLVIPSHWTPGGDRADYVQLRPTIQLTGAALLLRSTETR